MKLSHGFRSRFEFEFAQYLAKSKIKYEYEKYKFGQEEQGAPVITIDEFLMETRAGVRAGGLPGILGI